MNNAKNPVSFAPSSFVIRHSSFRSAANRRTTSPAAANPNAPVTNAAAPKPLAQSSAELASRFFLRRAGAVGPWIRGLLRRIHAGHAEIGEHVARKAVILPQLSPHIFQQIVLHGFREIADADGGGIALSAGAADRQNGKPALAAGGDEKTLVREPRRWRRSRNRSAAVETPAALAAVKNSAMAVTLHSG